MNILLLEDDDSITENLMELLSEERYRMTHAKTLSDAISRIEGGSFDLLLVDITLPDGNGYEITKYAERHEIPIIFLTASDDENSVVKGLESGAEDYITKPFRVRELLLRIKNVLRRKRNSVRVETVEHLSVDTDKGAVFKDGEEIALSALEYRLFLTFLNHRGILLTRNRLLEDIWDVAGDFVNDNTLTVYIKRLREKIEADPQKPRIIKTVRGIGYRMD